MLAQYNQALLHAKEQPVQVHHGVVAEASVRDWLGTFLPKRYGVVSGHIRSQCPPTPHQTKHFDVIIYDQVESPTLWTEDNKDKSQGGLVRIIPAEFVRAVLEVKAVFNRQTVRDALAKLSELKPLMEAFDAPSEVYPNYLPASAVLGTLFFELRADDDHDFEALNLFRAVDFQRWFYGAVIFRGERQNPDDTALISRTKSATQSDSIFASNGLLGGLAMTDTVEVKGDNIAAVLQWSDVNFSRFAFDLLAMLRGTYRPGFVSSFHGLDFSRAENNW